MKFEELPVIGEELAAELIPDEDQETVGSITVQAERIVIPETQQEIRTRSGVNHGLTGRFSGGGY